MNKTTFISVVLALLIVGGLWLWMHDTVVAPIQTPGQTTGSTTNQTPGKTTGQTGGTVTTGGYKTATYTIDGVQVDLVNGVSEVPIAPDAATNITTKYFGNEAIGDLNGDGLPDVAFILTQNSGGSGTFYYAVVALQNKDGSYTGTNTVLLGDRIAPQTTEIKGSQVVVNYADRAPGQPMTTKPSVGVSKYLVVKNGSLVEAPRTVGVGEHCGGNMTTAPVCAASYHCAPAPGSHLPFGDVGGVCVAN